MRLPRRRTLWLSTALLVAAVAGAWLFWPRGAVTQENLDRIQVGMTTEEVTAILGPDDVHVRIYRRDYEDRTWFCGSNTLAVRFKNGRVTEKLLCLYTAWEN